jgi:organic radical activating enzyme
MKSLRLLITEDCNLNCGYCCNKLPAVRQKFEYWNLATVLYNACKYDDICITGGEPLLNWTRVVQILKTLGQDHDVYLYTNGILLTRDYMNILEEYNISGVNVSLHYDNMNAVLDNLLTLPPEQSNKLITIRFAKHQLWDMRIKLARRMFISKEYELNDCFNNIENETWVVLT